MSLDDIQDSSYADSLEIPPSSIETTSEPSFNDIKDSNDSDDSAHGNSVGSKQRFESSEIFGSGLDQELHKEILEKLDIIKKEQKQDIQDSNVQENPKKEAYIEKIKNLEKSQTKNQVEKVISQDFEKIQKLVKAGLIDSKQGQNLTKQVLKKAFDKLVQAEKVKRALSPAVKNGNQLDIPVNRQLNKNEVFEEFSKNNPDFFASNGRQEVLNYLKSGDAFVGKDELSKISDIIRTVEKAAIDRYLQKVTHEKILRSSNEVAKKRLTVNAQKSSFSDKNLLRSFTREQIGKMSSAEFAKYESFIMDQLKKGLIK